MSDVMNGANSGANSEPIPPKRRRGNPNLRKGGPSLNPSGKAKPADQGELEFLRARVAELEAREGERESAEVDSAGGVVTAAKMRKVFGQDAGMDKGPTERRLREMLNKDGAKFLLTLRNLEAEETGASRMVGELAAARARVSELEAELRSRDAKPAEGVDAGSARAEALIDRILAECGPR